MMPRLILCQCAFGSNMSPRAPPNPRRQIMAFLHMLPDVGMNYTFNRPLLDGTSPARLKELSAVAHRIKDYESWYTVWLEVAKKAESEKRCWMPPPTITAPNSICPPATCGTRSTTTSRETGLSA